MKPSATFPPPYKFWTILLIMVLAESGSIMSTDLYTPSLPHLTEYFETTPELLKLTISLNLIAYFGVETQHFGYYQAAIVVAFFLGSMLATRLVDFWRPLQVLNLGLLASVTGSVIVIGLVFIGGLSPYSLTFGYLFIAFGLGPIFAVAPTCGMAAVEKSVGSAAAAFGSIEVGLSGVIAALVSVIHDDTPDPLGYVIGMTAVLAIVLGILAWRMDGERETAQATL